MKIGQRMLNRIKHQFNSIKISIERKTCVYYKIKIDKERKLFKSYRFEITFIIQNIFAHANCDV